MIGKFITFEGSEGSGKSTQVELLYQYLKGKGYKVLCLREPGGTKISERIRAILLDLKNHAMGPECEMLLYMAARAQIVKEIIAPALKKGQVVLCDRFQDSTIVYQGFGLGMDIKAIKYIGNFVTGRIKPDLTILLDLPAPKGLDRRGKNKDRIEKRALKYHLRVRRGYLKLAKSEPRRIKIVGADKSRGEIQKKIREIVDRELR